MNDTDTTDQAAPAELQTELTLDLREPITHATIEYTFLKLTEPTAGDLIKASKASGEFEQIALLIALNAKVPRGMVDRMKQRDFEAAAAFYANF